METLQQIAEKIKRAKKVAIFAHMRPDGDAYGSALALSRALGGWVENRTLLASSRPLSLSALCEPLIHTLATRLQPILTDIGCLY